MKKTKLPAVAEAMITLCKDEEALKEAVSDVVAIVQDRLAEMGVATQERIRDTIRSEAFATTFRDKVAAYAHARA